MKVSRRTFLSASGLTGLAGVAPGALRAAAPRPNILIVTTDQQFADALSARLGDRYLRTPAMDSLAANGALFTRAYCANPLCVPSRTSMYTGRYPVETGIQTNDRKQIDPAKFPCMGAIFRRAGYETAYTGKWHLPFSERDERHGFTILPPKNDNRDAGPADAAIDFLRARHARPFLLVTSLLNPHNICEWARGQALPNGPIGEPPPIAQCPPWRPNHAPQNGEPGIVARMRRSYQSTRMFPVSGFDENKWRQYIWAYYRMIEKVDGHIGRVLEALRQSGQAEKTLVVFTADHGDCQGAHGWNQKTILYEEAARVPFILSYPGAIRRLVSERLVNTGIDLIPTLCDFAGVPGPENLPGTSLRKTALGQEKQDPREFVVVCDRLAQGAEGDPIPDGRMLRGRRYKYTAYSEGERRESLVDLERDPGEMTNLAADPSHRQLLQSHRAILAGWCHRFGDSFPVPA